LNNDDSIGSFDFEKLRVVDQVGTVFRDNLEAISFRDPDRLHHRPMDAIGDAVAGLLQAAAF
jgi:hypothetical protein